MKLITFDNRLKKRGRIKLDSSPIAQVFKGTIP